MEVQPSDERDERVFGWIEWDEITIIDLDPVIELWLLHSPWVHNGHESEISLLRKLLLKHAVYAFIDGIEFDDADYFDEFNVWDDSRWQGY